LEKFKFTSGHRFKVRNDLFNKLLFLALLGIRHVLDNCFLITLPLSTPLSISREVVSVSDLFLVVLSLDP
jgi:hypothetical protein